MLDLVDRAMALLAAPLFRGLDAPALLELAAVARPEGAAAGSTLPHGALRVVLRGRVGSVGPGGVVGARGALGGTEELPVVEDALLLRLEADDLLDALEQEPALAVALCALLS